MGWYWNNSRESVLRPWDAPPKFSVAKAEAWDDGYGKSASGILNWAPARMGHRPREFNFPKKQQFKPILIAVVFRTVCLMSWPQHKCKNTWLYFLTAGQVALLQFSQWSVLEPSGIRAERLIPESGWTCTKESRHPLQATVTRQELRVKVPKGVEKAT